MEHDRNMRPYGYTADREDTVHSEAAVIIDAIARTLDGESLRSITRSFNDQGIKTSNGRLWRPATLKRTMLNELNLEKGLVTKGDYEKLRAMLTDPNRRRSHAYGLAHLLTGGYVRCGLCGCAMVSRGDSYTCPVTPVGCGRTRIRADSLDTYMRDRTLALLTRQETRTALKRLARRTARHDAAVKTASARMGQAAADYTNGDIDRAAWLAVTREHRRLTKIALREKARLAATYHLPKPLTYRNLAKWWEQASTTAQREILGLVLDHVKINPAPDRRRPHDGTVDERRLEVNWLPTEEDD